MKLKDLKIGSQLMLGFATMFIFVIILGSVSNYQADRIHLQTEGIYNHPLLLRRAISNIKIDILNMRLSTRDLMLASNASEKRTAIETMELTSADVQKQFNLL